MGKQMPNLTADWFLSFIAQCDVQVVCNAEPTTYAEAMQTYKLADIAMAAGSSGGDYALADDTSGRKVSMSAKNGATIDVTGSATHVALCCNSGSTLRWVTTCDPQVLTSGGTVDFPSWKENLQDPT